MRGFVIFDGMCVEELSSVVRVVTGGLKPNRQIVLIVPSGDELWKAALEI
jgi:hypothetical protein